ncbi:hypothetical protein GF359_09270, partial [candidate division WOR-3 bacterium]|nr:hypothetical protein [candidate division WOR-3 bacterium]MBD3365389.1 hypothetical protein [candidate division WOR-3 bacterium]
MAKRSKRKAKPTRTRSTPSSTRGKTRKKDNTDVVIGLLLILLAVFFTISLASFNPAGIDENPLNWGGIVGLKLAQFLFNWLGVAAYVIPLLLLIWGINRVLRKPAKRLVFTTLVLLGFAFLTQVTLGYFPKDKIPLYPLKNPAGIITESYALSGHIGTSVFRYLSNRLGRVGLGFILGFLLLASLVVIFGINLPKILNKLVDSLKEKAKIAAEESRERRAAMRAERAERLRKEKEEMIAARTREESRIDEIPEPLEEEPEPVPEPVRDTREAEHEAPKERIIRSPLMAASLGDLHLAELLDPVPDDLAQPPDREPRQGARMLKQKLEEF